jgi:CheY-like chemotaxis protein/anti-sigma regulatory factor (Ser/Thr protein kinase)
MANVLVVDDSAADRELASHLLEKQGWTVSRVGDGKQALVHLENHTVDVVLTDLVMPELDGLAVVERVKAAFPAVPVILMTARGSEELAMRALQNGAASYVPKSLLVRDLVEVVSRILDASREHQSYRRLLGRLRGASFVLENDPDLISSLVSYLTSVLRDSEIFGEADCRRIATALDEALTNACYHGNLEMGSEMREQGPRAYKALVNQRRAVAPYRDRMIRINADLTPHEARFVIQDEGLGFNVNAIPDPTSPDNLERRSGRGVFLMKTFMDDVRYNEPGNEVTLVKRRPEQPT